MSEHTADHADHADHAHDEPPHYNYPKIYGVLLVLLVISILGPELDIQIVTLVTAFGIAFVKAGIVVKYFMHFGAVPKFVHYFMATALVFMVLFFAGTAPDVKNHDGHQWENVAAKAEVQRALAETGAVHKFGRAPQGHLETDLQVWLAAIAAA